MPLLVAHSLSPIAVSAAHATLTGIFPILARHSAGPGGCTESPLASTATVTGMSFTSNS